MCFDLVSTHTKFGTLFECRSQKFSGIRVSGLLDQLQSTLLCLGLLYIIAWQQEIGCCSGTHRQTLSVSSVTLQSNPEIIFSLAAPSQDYLEEPHKEATWTELFTHME